MALVQSLAQGLLHAPEWPPKLVFYLKKSPVLTTYLESETFEHHLKYLSIIWNIWASFDCVLLKFYFRNTSNWSGLWAPWAKQEIKTQSPLKQPVSCRFIHSLIFLKNTKEFENYSLTLKRRWSVFCVSQRNTSPKYTLGCSYPTRVPLVERTPPAPSQPYRPCLCNKKQRQKLA